MAVKALIVNEVHTYAFDRHQSRHFTDLNAVQFNSIHAFISDKSPYYTGYINYNHRLLIIN